MGTKNLKDLIAIRRQWVQSSKDNNFDFDSILAGIYNDPSHFIYEILQNAEDAKATEISFNLSESKLEIKHNGKDFDFDDVDGITGIGISTKKDDINAIGKFGVGFKSVFAITKTPIIHSGIFHFKIEEFVIPIEINNDNEENTQIVLQFNHPKRTKKEVFEIIRKKLESLELKTLLFLNNIKQINWITPGKFGHYSRETRKINHYKNVFKTRIKSDTNHDKIEEKFLVLQKPIFLDSHNLNVELAYRISSNQKKRDYIIQEKDSKLFAFFPTEKVTFLNFLIQGPYKTTPNRENIPLDDPQNQFIISETADLVSDSIKIIKEIGLLSTSFLEILPIDPNHLSEGIYSTFFNKVKETLTSKVELLPTSKNNFTNSQYALLARGKELTEILDEKDLNILFNKKAWLDNNITYDRTRLLRDYLVGELNIKEIDFENFVVNIKKEFIEKKSDNWLIEFYGRLLNQRSLWEKSHHYLRNEGILRKIPIMRLLDNNHIEPCDVNDNIQVYLPSLTSSKYKTVKETLIEDEKALKFLIELGLSNPDIFSEIREFIIPKYKNPKDISDDEYYEDIEKLLIAFGKNDSEKKVELFNELKDLPIVFSRNSFNGEQYLVTPQETYLPTQELKEYFKEYDSVYFLSEEFEEYFPDKVESLWKLLIALGCETKPRRITIDPSLTGDEKLLLRKQTYQSKVSYESHTYDYNYEGLDNFLKLLTIEKSVTLWNFLVRSIESYDNWKKENFFKGEYCWFYYSSYSQNFESKFLKILKTTKWLFSEDGNTFSPDEILISQLPDCYSKNGESVEVLADVLEFQTDEIKRLEEKTGKKVFLLNEEQAKKVMELLGINGDKSYTSLGNSEDPWTPEVEPENTKISFEILEPEIIVTTDLRGQRPDDNNDGDEGTDNKQDSVAFKREMMSITELKDIGNWGERFVYKHLQEAYADDIHIKIIWLNNEKNVGVGYDFSIVRNGKEIEYIEVKSKIDNTPQLIEITGAQWEFARKLYNENEGEKYKIYVVSAAGSRKAKIGIINNPIKLWKEGKLYAHPVQFKL